MPLSKLTTEPEKVIQALPDNPKMASNLLKAKFDEGSRLIKEYINNTLTTQIDASLVTVVTGQIPSGSITLDKLDPNLQTSLKSNASSNIYAQRNLGGF
jgi:hypothetical protein